MAEMGSFAELSADPEGAFSRLMEWQLSGGEQGNREQGKQKEGVGVAGAGERGLVGVEEDVEGEELAENVTVRAEEGAKDAAA